MQVLEPGGFFDRGRADQVIGQAPLACRPLEDLVGPARELPVDAAQEPAVPERVVAPSLVARPRRKCGGHGAGSGFGVVLLGILRTRLPGRVVDLGGALCVGGKRRIAAYRRKSEITRGGRWGARDWRWRGSRCWRRRWCGGWCRRW